MDGQCKVNEEGRRENFTMVPNIIDDLDLSPYAVRLYLHLKRVAGDTGSCYQSGKTISEKCKMSTGMITKAKRELMAAGLISVALMSNGKNIYHDITILDVWKRNSLSHSERDRSCGETDRSPGETINNPINNITINNTSSPIGETQISETQTQISKDKVKKEKKGIIPLEGSTHEKIVRIFGGKYFQNPTQIETIEANLKTWGETRILDYFTWARNINMSLGNAIAGMTNGLKKRAAYEQSKNLYNQEPIETPEQRRKAAQEKKDRDDAFVASLIGTSRL